LVNNPLVQGLQLPQAIDPKEIQAKLITVNTGIGMLKEIEADDPLKIDPGASSKRYTIYKQLSEVQTYCDTELQTKIVSLLTGLRAIPGGQALADQIAAVLHQLDPVPEKPPTSRREIAQEGNASEDRGGSDDVGDGGDSPDENNQTADAASPLLLRAGGIGGKPLELLEDLIQDTMERMTHAMRVLRNLRPAPAGASEEEVRRPARPKPLTSGDLPRGQPGSVRNTK